MVWVEVLGSHMLISIKYVSKQEIDTSNFKIIVKTTVLQILVSDVAFIKTS